MRSVYWVWAAGLILKMVGAAWDVAWHFRYLREALTPPHLVNVAGSLLLGAAILHELRHPAPHRSAPLAVVLVGVGVFAFAIPFDQVWHEAFGIDITTWSPAHLLLFAGTAIAVTGVTLLFLADLRHERAPRGLAFASASQRAMLALLVVLLVESVAFPLTYNEYTTLAVRDAVEHPSRLDAAIVTMALSVPDPVFHGTPHWLYPVYGVVVGAFLATLLRSALGPGWGAVALAGYAAMRATANAALVADGWPEAVVPLQFVALGVAVELAWMLPARERVRAALGAALGAAAAYAYFVAPLSGVARVPLDASSAPAGVALACAAGLLALALRDRSEAILGRVPVVAWDRIPGRVADWARERWN